MDRLPFVFPFADPPPYLAPPCFRMDTGGMTPFNRTEDGGTGCWTVPPPLMRPPCFPPPVKGYPGGSNYQGMHDDQGRKRPLLEYPQSEKQHFERVPHTNNNPVPVRTPDNSQSLHHHHSTLNMSYLPPVTMPAASRPLQPFGFFDYPRYGPPLSPVDNSRTIYPNQPRFYLTNDMKDYGFFNKDNYWHSRFRPMVGLSCTRGVSWSSCSRGVSGSSCSRGVSGSSCSRRVQNNARGGRPYVPINTGSVKPFYITGSNVADYDQKDAAMTNAEPQSKKQFVKEDEDLRDIVDDLLDLVINSCSSLV